MKIDSHPGTALRALRLVRGLRQSKLADQVGASQALLSLIEKGERALPPSLSDALGEVLGVPPSYFQHVHLEPKQPECSFRSLRSTPALARDQAAAQVQLCLYAVAWIEKYVRLPDVNVPILPGASPPEAAAECRRHWRLGEDRPIGHVIRLLENAGVIVAAFASLSPKLDAFSTRDGHRPIAVLSTSRAEFSCTRRRWSLAHELGHLVLHADLDGYSPEKEREADQFAAAFLMPHHSFFRAFPRRERGISWNEIFDIKERWKISAAAVVYRARELQLISEAQYRRANITLRRNWSTSEPREPELENPEMLPAAFSLFLARRGHSVEELFQHLHLSPETLNCIAGCSVDLREPCVTLSEPDRPR